MNKEIEEILDYLRDEKVIYGSFGSEYKKVNLDEIKLLLDYITKLQEENKNLHIKLEDKANEQIKTMYEEYKSRIDKAIEYIEMVKYFALIDKVNILSISTLENILKGEKNEKDKI